MPFDHKIALDLFRANGVKDDCPSCGNTTMRLGKDTVLLPYAGSDATQDLRPSILAIPTICANCGHIRLFLERED